jgi:hypothetical protein
MRLADAMMLPPSVSRRVVRGIALTGISLAAAAVLLRPAVAKQDHTNLDESKVGTYTLPPLLVARDGTPIRTPEQWIAKRRPEIMKLYEDNVYGHVPAWRPENMRFMVVEESPNALGGTAHRKQVEIRFSSDPNSPVLHLLLYTPANAKGRVPVFLCLHFSGNWAITDDPGVRLYELWDRREQKRVMPAADVKRGTSKEWNVPLVLERGYGVAAINYSDIEPDPADKDAPTWQGSPLGVRALLRPAGEPLDAPDAWGDISAWAWGMSRGLDYLLTDHQVDPRNVIAVGQSRLGKTVLWAGAQDERFAMVVASCSGEGGAALSRRDYGENVDNMTTTYLYQFSGNFKRFYKHWDDLPVDAHMLISLIAPRPLFLNTGTEDQWSDPKGEFLGAQAASPAYELFGKKGLADVTMPPPDTPVFRDIAFHEHTGRHAILATDWKAFLDFADLKLVRTR